MSKKKNQIKDMIVPLAEISIGAGMMKGKSNITKLFGVGIFAKGIKDFSESDFFGMKKNKK